MVAGNEDIYTSVIEIVDSVPHRKDWAAIGWIDVGPATEADIATYPTVVENPA